MKTGDQQRKNDYSCVAFHKGEKVNFMRFVHSIQTYQKWLEKQGIEWEHINVYWRRSSTFKERIYRN